MGTAYCVAYLDQIPFPLNNYEHTHTHTGICPINQQDLCEGRKPKDSSDTWSTHSQDLLVPRHPLSLTLNVPEYVCPYL